MSETGIWRDIARDISTVINVDPVIVLPSNDPRLSRVRARARAFSCAFSLFPLWPDRAPGRFYRAAFQFSCSVYATVSVPPFTERATNVTIAPMNRNGCIL